MSEKKKVKEGKEKKEHREKSKKSAVVSPFKWTSVLSDQEMGSCSPTEYMDHELSNLPHGVLDTTQI